MPLIIRSVGVGSHANIRMWQPEDPSIVAEDVYVSIGLKSKKGADIFHIRIATPAGLATLEDHQGIIATRPLLVMRRYTFDDLWHWLERTVTSCEEETWPSCVEKLKLYFGWEYDGYDVS